MGLRLEPHFETEDGRKMFKGTFKAVNDNGGIIAAGHLELATDIPTAPNQSVTVPLNFVIPNESEPLGEMRP